MPPAPMRRMRSNLSFGRKECVAAVSRPITVSERALRMCIQSHYALAFVSLVVNGGGIVRLAARTSARIQRVALERKLELPARSRQALGLFRPDQAPRAGRSGLVSLDRRRK